MKSWVTNRATDAAHPEVRVHLQEGTGAASDWCFTRPFRIGRDPECDVRVEAGQVSRVHAEVTFESGSWWIRDLASTNGTYVDGEQVTRARLEDQTTLRIGREGPVLHISLWEVSGEDADRRAAGDIQDRTTPERPDVERPDQDPRQERPRHERPSLELPNAERPGAGPPGTERPNHERPGADRPRHERPTPERPSAGRLSPKPPTPERTREETSNVQNTKPPAAGDEATSQQAPYESKSAGADPSVEAYIRKYFDPDAGPAGDHTRMIRRAYAEVHKKHQRRYVWIVGAVAALLVLVGGYAIVQELRINQFERLAAGAFYNMKEMDAQLAQLKSVFEETNETSLSERLADLEQSRRESREAYEHYIEELGVRRKLTPEEDVIYRMANIFNESETEIPPDFIREVREGITFWQSQGRVDLTRAVERANQEGYTEYIVRTMQRYGLPPQFFYLALQESKFDVTAVGTPTRFGYAKGMWQFIPETAERYGLDVGGLANYRQYDAQDERHDFERSTEAAARYLRDIYGQLAQASALLAMASYNWGEGRVVPKLKELLEDIPDDPRARSYWRFYEEYSSRMPDETKDYVRKIFAAAVIGEDPRLFGFDFDNPLAKYMEVGSSAEL